MWIFVCFLDVIMLYFLTWETKNRKGCLPPLLHNYFTLREEVLRPSPSFYKEEEFLILTWFRQVYLSLLLLDCAIPYLRAKRNEPSTTAIVNGSVFDIHYISLIG